jgi:hypothetical protein
VSQTFSLVTQVQERLLRLNLIRLTNLREQVQVTYWSEIHFIPESLFRLLPFGIALGPTPFYQFIDFRLSTLVNLARLAQTYWRINPVYTYAEELVSELTLSVDDTFFWHYYVPAKTQEITEALLQGNRIRFLSSFHLSETQIKVEFHEIRLQTTDQGTRFVGTLGKEYTYRWDQSDWTITSLNTENTIVNPIAFYYPITEPNAQGHETEYQERLTTLLRQPTNFGIDQDYWNSVDSTDLPDSSDTESNPPGLTSRADTPVLDTCSCGIDICYCDRYRPDTPPTPPFIELWRPSQGPQPIQGVHYQRLASAN